MEGMTRDARCGECSPPTSRRLGTFLLMLSSVLLALLASEIFLRLFYPIDDGNESSPRGDGVWRERVHRRSAVPGLAYELASDYNGPTIKTNSYGMRDDEPCPLDQISARRIVVIGDSFTFGFGVQGDQTYSHVLEQRLNAPFQERRYDVLNLGVGGYSTRDEALVLRYKGLALDPVLIILGYVLNDPEVAPVQPLHRHFQTSRWWEDFNISRLAARFRLSWDVRRLGDGDYLRYLHASPAKWGSVLTAFSDIRVSASRRDIPVLVLIFPLMQEAAWSEYPYSDLHRRVAAAAEAAGLHALDLYDSFAQHPPSAVRLAARDPHPSALGHQLTARAIHHWLVDRDIPGMTGKVLPVLTEDGFAAETLPCP